MAGPNGPGVAPTGNGGATLTAPGWRHLHAPPVDGAGKPGAPPPARRRRSLLACRPASSSDSRSTDGVRMDRGAPAGNGGATLTAPGRRHLHAPPVDGSGKPGALSPARRRRSPSVCRPASSEYEQVRWVAGPNGPGEGWLRPATGAPPSPLPAGGTSMHPLWTGVASRAPSHPPAAAVPRWCTAPPAVNIRSNPILTTVRAEVGSRCDVTAQGTPWGL